MKMEQIDIVVNADMYYNILHKYIIADMNLSFLTLKWYLEISCNEKYQINVGIEKGIIDFYRQSTWQQQHRERWMTQSFHLPSHPIRGEGQSGKASLHFIPMREK